MADDVLSNLSVRKPRQRSSGAATHSLARILNLVRLRQAETRQQLEKISELGRAIVADRLNALTEMGLVDESKLGTATGGRAPRLITFRNDAARLLVATLDQTAIGVAITDLSGTLLTEHHEAFDQTVSADATTNRLITLFEWLIEKSETATPIWGVGVSMPVPVQSETDGWFTKTTPTLLPTWDEHPFVERLMTHFHAPVWLRSSVETMTMGEVKAGAGADAQCLLFLKIGKRIGAAMVNDGHLYRGAKGATGLIGQSPVAVNGSTGSLDLLAGSDAIARAGQTAGENGSSSELAEICARGEPVTAIDVGQAAQMGDPVAMEIMAQSGRLIGHVTASLANMLNPSKIILSGSIAQTNDILLAAVREAVYGDSHPLVTRDLTISASQLGSSAGLIGAAAVVSEGLFEPDHLRAWISEGTPLQHPELQDALDLASDKLAASPATEASNSAPPAA